MHEIPIDPVKVIQGSLLKPRETRGLIALLSDTNQGPQSEWNRMAAEVFCKAGFMTLRCGIQTPDELRQIYLTLDIPALARRIGAVTRWVQRNVSSVPHPVILFATGFSAVAALWAAASNESEIDAVVSVGDGPDLIASRLGDVRVPTLFLIGERDPYLSVIRQRVLAAVPNGQAAVISGAGHRLHEPGLLGSVTTEVRAFAERLHSRPRFTQHDAHFH